jgi:hypothetical protein
LVLFAFVQRGNEDVAGISEKAPALKFSGSGRAADSGPRCSHGKQAAGNQATDAAEETEVVGNDVGCRVIVI